MEDQEEQIKQLQSKVEIVQLQMQNTIQNISKRQAILDETTQKYEQLNQQIQEMKKSIEAYKQLKNERENEVKQKKDQNIMKRNIMGNDLYKRWEQLQQDLFAKEDLDKQLKDQLEFVQALGEQQQGPVIQNPEQAVTEFYDLVVEIDSLLGILEGWKYHINAKYSTQQAQNDFIKYLEKDKCVVGIIGMSNKGKSHILGKVNNIDVPEGYDVHTQGVSVVKGNETVGLVCDFLDTQGLGVSLQYKQNKNVQDIIQRVQLEQNEPVMQDLLNKKKVSNEGKKYKEELAQCYSQLNQDRHLTEQFLQSFMMEKCHILIIVVGCQTAYEQELIIQLSKIHKDKTIIVIHNFSNLFKNTQIEKQIKKDIINCYDILYVAQTYGDTTAHTFLDQTFKRDIDQIEDSCNPVIHMIYCRENSEAGNKYNNGTINHLRTIISHQITRQDQHQNIFAALESFFSEKFRQQLGGSIPIQLKFKDGRFALENKQIIKEDKFLEKLQNCHQMPFSSNEPLYVVNPPRDYNENGYEYKKLNFKIDLSMIPDLEDQLNFLIEDNEVQDYDLETYVLVKKYDKFYYLEININRTKLKEMEEAEKSEGWKVKHPMNFKPIKMNKKILGNQINLDETMPFKYEKGVFCGYLRCDNYPKLIDGGIIEDDEKDLQKIYIGGDE